MFDNDLRQRAMQIARTADVATLKDCAVVFSVSFLPTRENKEKAAAYMAANPQAQTIEHTPCGKELVALEMEKYLADEEIAEIWAVASKRYIAQASGNITAFVQGADPRGVFLRVELPGILQNPNIMTINGIDKHKFRV